MMTIMWTMVLPLLPMMVTVNVMTIIFSDDEKPSCSTNIVGPWLCLTFYLRWLLHQKTIEIMMKSWSFHGHRNRVAGPTDQRLPMNMHSPGLSPLLHNITLRQRWYKYHKYMFEHKFWVSQKGRIDVFDHFFLRNYGQLCFTSNKFWPFSDLRPFWAIQNLNFRSPRVDWTAQINPTSP